MSAGGGRKPWWKGARGEWLVVAQIALMALVFFGPRALPGLPAPAFPLAGPCRIAGALLMILGGGLLFFGIGRLGRALTPLPYPRDGATLVDTGPYALVCHPMYGGGLVLAFGWALCVRSWLTVAYALVLFVFLDLKSRREEKWLREKFPAYCDYQRRVRRLIPYIY